MGTQSENWLWTLDVQDKPEVELQGFVERTYAEGKTGIKYILAGEEIGPENGRRHFQGLVCVNHRMRGGTVKKLFDDNRVHIGDRDGRAVRSLEDAIKYCRKDGHWYGVGVEPKFADKGSGTVKRWERARDLAKAGKVQSIFEENPEFIRYQDHLLRYAAKFNKPADRATLDNFWIHGPTGSGKSRMVRQLEGEKLYVVGEIGRFMWQDYDPDQHEAVLFDDMRAEDIRPHLKVLKNILDHYPFRAELKGSSLGLIRPLRVYFTSLLPMEQVVPHDHIGEFARRVKCKSTMEA